MKLAWLVLLVGSAQGGGPLAPPSLLAGSQTAGPPIWTDHLTWTAGDTHATTEVWVDGTGYATVSAGIALYDVVSGSPPGVRSFQVRHKKNGQYSAFSNTLTL